MLVLRIPFSQQERMTEQEAHGYAASIASGLGAFFGMQGK